MTYKQLIDTLTTLIDDHYLINQWGYGNLSDIETPETGAPNYPYTFINPVQVLIQNYGFDVTLNLIQMDQPLETVDAEIDGVSTSLGIIQDIIAKFKLTPLYQDTDIILSVQCTPFKERFKDSVVGVTAVVTFQISEPLDACVNVAPSFEELVWVRATTDQVVDPDVPQNLTVWKFTTILQTDGHWQNYNRYEVQTEGVYKLVLDADITLQEPLVGESLPGEPKIALIRTGLPNQFIQPDVLTGWPTAYVDSSTVYTIHAEWTIETSHPTAIEWQLVGQKDEPGPESGLVEKAGSELKIYRKDR